jgi:DeoR family fructose operon transcriptional repressor
MNDRSLKPEIRKKIILDLINSNDFVSTHTVMDKCNVSEITVRRDLTELEGMGLLIRTHGGAVKSVAAGQLFTYDSKISRNSKNKESICRTASSFIENNDIIFIDCGTTLSFMSKYVTKFESLTIITNSLPIASGLINFPAIKLILIGGEVINERKAIYGLFADRNISQFHANKAFIGADGVSLSGGLTSFDENEASVTLKMAENSDKVYLLCDSSKIEKDSFVRFAPLSAVDVVITDSELDERYMTKYKKHNIQIIKSN